MNSLPPLSFLLCCSQASQTASEFDFVDKKSFFKKISKEKCSNFFLFFVFFSLLTVRKSFLRLNFFEEDFNLFFSCSKEEKTTNTLFSLVNTSKTNIHFKNNVKENLYFNFLNYAYIYNGGGVAVGDINNDGVINIIDVVLIVNIVLDENDNPSADFNNDGLVNILDIVLIVNIILS